MKILCDKCGSVVSSYPVTKKLEYSIKSVGLECNTCGAYYLSYYTNYTVEKLQTERSKTEKSYRKHLNINNYAARKEQTRMKYLEKQIGIEMDLLKERVEKEKLM